MLLYIFTFYIMKKYFFLLLLSFVLVSCEKEENTSIITTEVQQITDSGNNIIDGDNSILNTWELIKTWSEEVSVKSKEKEEIINNIKEWWEEYKNTQYWFSVSYPKQAYMQTKCWSETKDELVDLKIFQKDNKFKIWYWKKLSNCNLVDINSFEELSNFSINFSIYNSKNTDSFVKENIVEICKIDKTEKWELDSNLTEIFIVMKPEILECIENDTCNQYNRFSCGEPFYSLLLFDLRVSKGVRFWYNSLDYYIQKYPTFQETIDKWSYDKEIVNTFKFD